MSEYDTHEVELAYEYQQALDAILGIELTPSVIDQYAEQALGGLIALVERVVEQYNPYVAGSTEQNAAVEAAAFQHYGLGDIGIILSHLAAQAKELRDLDSFIGKATVGDIFVPPERREMIAIRPGDGSFTEKATQPRTKTALFVLGNVFGVNVRDGQQLTLTTGITTANMMRRESYSLIHATALQRAILICDEVENATYVFDTDALQQTGIAINELALLSKAELNALLRSAPDIGQRFIFTKAFVRQLVAALESPETILDPDESTAIDKRQAGQYLYPKAPEGTLSATGYARAQGINKRLAIRAVKACAHLLGPTQKYQFGTSRVSVGYNELQQHILDQYVSEHKATSDPVPGGYLSVHGMHEHPDFRGVSTLAIESAISELGDALGDVTNYVFGAIETNGYSPKQQQAIWKRLEERGLFSPEATDDILPIHKTTRELGLPLTVVLDAIDKLGEQLGKAQKYRFGPRVAIGYTPAQRKLIHDYAVQAERAIPKAPDGVRSAFGISSTNEGLTQYMVEKAIQQLGDVLRPRGPYRFGSQVTVGYSADEQGLIVETAQRLKKIPGSK